MNTHSCQCHDDYQARQTTHHRAAWRNAVAALVSPFVRLHELRNARTQMLHDALRDVDCGKPRSHDA